ncbi:ATPase, T2SS/T4P/T4SS family [Alicyclobacillus sp.]|uniref:GspE/PulE family protein n=1 Tax=Alicyclobacillus sp. TaxID=61169 RepID=UPI0025BB7800|nr:ATPase, T2SS/T4P/T4SS family [Alicyclobacillus sp.]MCL6516168.1 Flp pilus assembly complex ATPase component TadA [Alicyclobacillus sp.]
MEEWSTASLLQRILDDAVENRCTDVHIFPAGDGIRVQMRCDGRLHPYLDLPTEAASIIRKVKALARMDVAETRVPQDGSFHWDTQTAGCDVRVATLPTVRGETAVLRLFPGRRTCWRFEDLGMSREQAEAVSLLLEEKHGMVLVAGGTGAGKTTTLYTMMWHLSNLGKRVVSIEDPVERTIENCHQVEVRERAGITFGAGIRAVLRHDPDVIMVGEIRDEPTAQAAARAALGGHLVISTTHARDWLGAAIRLCELGVSRSVAGEVLRAVIVQELAPAARLVDVERTGDGGPFGQEGRAQFAIHRVTGEASAWIASDRPWAEVRRWMERQAPAPRREA